MKKFIHALSVLLCAVLLLSACVQSDAGSTADKTPVAPVPGVPSLPPEYKTVIHNLINAYPWHTEDTSTILENPELSYLYCRSTDLSDVGFALLDLDGNGQAELLISDIAQEYVYDAYTLADGQAVHLFSSGDRSRYFVRENGYVEHVGSGGGGLTCNDFYKLNGGELSFVERITYDTVHALETGLIDDISQANEVDTFFRSATTLPADYQQITAEEARDAIEAHRQNHPCLQIPYTTLAAYENASETVIRHVVITCTDFLYSYEITGHDGQIIAHVDNLTGEPQKQYVSEDIAGIVIQAGTGLSTNYAVYYHLENGAVSDTFHYVLAAQKDYVVYVEHREGEYLLTVQNIFDKDRYYKEHKLENVSPVAADCVIDGYFDTQGHVVITYLTGEEYTETSYTIEI